MWSLDLTLKGRGSGLGLDKETKASGLLLGLVPDDSPSLRLEGIVGLSDTDRPGVLS